VLEGWPISPSVRIGVLRYLVGVVEGRLPDDVEDDGSGWVALSKPGHRERLAAARAIIAAHGQNLEALRVELGMGADDRGERVDEDVILEAQRIRERRRAAASAGG
jgi:hypothetical protein